MARTRKKEVELQGNHIACYTRLSVEDTNPRESNSIEIQKKIVENFVNDNFEKCNSFVVYEDGGFSGADFNRPRFLDMLEDIEQGKINCIVVKDLSRIGRNYIDVGYYVEKYFPLKKVRFISINDNYDSKYNEFDFVTSFKNVLNEVYILDVSKKIKAVKKRQMLEGKYIGNNPPFGYKKSAEDKYKLEINPDTAWIVHKVYQLVLDGHSIMGITKIMNEECIMTPSQYLLKQKPDSKILVSGNWYGKSILKILKSEMCIGNMVQGVRSAVRPKQEVFMDKEDWIIVPNTHEAIISKEVFNEVQERLAELSEKHKTAFSNHLRYDKNSDFVPLENIFKGKLFCKGCGAVVGIGHSSVNKKDAQKTIYSYACRNKQRGLRTNCQSLRAITREKLAETVGTLIRKHVWIVLNEDLAAVQYVAERKSLLKSLDSRIASHKKMLDKTNKEQKQLFEKYARGGIEDEPYYTQLCQNEQKIDFVQKQYEEVVQQKADVEKTIEEMLVLKNMVSSSFELTRDVLDRFVKRIEISPETIDIEFTFDFPFAKGGFQGE